MDKLSRRTKKDIFEYIPPGILLPFAGTTAPTGWAMCDGAEVSRTDNRDLFLAIEDIYGVGDGSTTFNLPDLRGVFIRGLDNMGTAQGAAGKDPDVRTIGSQQLEKTRQPRNNFSFGNAGNHNHNIWRSPISGNNNNPPSYNGGLGAGITGTTQAGVSDWNSNLISTGGTHSHSISGGDNESRPINRSINYIIKL